MPDTLDPYRGGPDKDEWEDEDAEPVPADLARLWDRAISDQVATRPPPPRKDEMGKHMAGRHDQKSHGRRGGGGGNAGMHRFKFAVEYSGDMDRLMGKNPDAPDDPDAKIEPSLRDGVAHVTTIARTELDARLAAEQMIFARGLQPTKTYAVGPGHEGERMVQQVRESGGFSVRVGSGIVPRTGFMVARGNKAEEVDLGHVDDVTPAKVSSYIAANRATLDKPGNYLGGWVDGRGHVIMDISQRVLDRAKAVRLGREREQDAIFDLTNFEEIITKGLVRKAGLPVRFWLDKDQPPEQLVEDIKRFYREAT